MLPPIHTQTYFLPFLINHNNSKTGILSLPSASCLLPHPLPLPHSSLQPVPPTITPSNSSSLSSSPTDLLPLPSSPSSSSSSHPSFYPNFFSFQHPPPRPSPPSAGPQHPPWGSSNRKRPRHNCNGLCNGLGALRRYLSGVNRSLSFLSLYTCSRHRHKTRTYLRNT